MNRQSLLKSELIAHINVCKALIQNKLPQFKLAVEGSREVIKMIKIIEEFRIKNQNSPSSYNFISTYFDLLSLFNKLERGLKRLEKVLFVCASQAALVKL